MGSPLAPVLANILMFFYESKCPNEYNVNKPKFYLRYNDDILAAFDKEQDSLNFFNFFSLLFLMYSFEVSVIKISHFKHITN